jgi:hypothetical protein
MPKGKRKAAPVPVVTDDDIFGEKAAAVAAPPAPVVTQVVTETVPEPPITRPERPGRLVAGRPSSVHLEDALLQWGLSPDDVGGWRETPEVALVVVTTGGTKLHWPQDMDRVLTDAEKGRAKPPALQRSIFIRETAR